MISRTSVTLAGWVSLTALILSPSSYSQDRGLPSERPRSTSSSNTVNTPESVGYREGSRAFGRQEYVQDQGTASSEGKPSVPHEPTALNFSSMNRSVTILTEDETPITPAQQDRALLQLQQIALARPSYITHQRAGAFEVRVILTKEKGSEIDSAASDGLDVRLGTDRVLTAKVIAKAFGSKLISTSIGGGNTLEEIAKAINWIQE